MHFGPSFLAPSLRPVKMPCLFFFSLLPIPIAITLPTLTPSPLPSCPSVTSTMISSSGHEEQAMDKSKRSSCNNDNGEFSINENVDLLAEILGRLDGRSLGVAGCVCRLWCTVSRRDSVWETVCNLQVFNRLSSSSPSVKRNIICISDSGSTRSVVAALGGYRRLYQLCIGPGLDRLAGSDRSTCWAVAGWGEVGETARLSLSLSLSLFSIDFYERLMGGGGGTGGGTGERPPQRPASLLFLYNPVDVS